MRDYLNGAADADPDSVVDDVMRDLEQETIMEAARFGVSTIAHEVVRNSRNTSIRPGESGRWTGAAAAAAEHRDIFMDRICVGYDEDRHGIWKFLGDCTKADLIGAAGIKQKQADGLLNEVARYEKLARKLDGEATVNTLDQGEVEEVLFS